MHSFYFGATLILSCFQHFGSLPSIVGGIFQKKSTPVILKTIFQLGIHERNHGRIRLK